MLDSKAITKIQSIILIAIIVVAAIGAYVLFSGNEQSSDTIKIGVVADIDLGYGKETLQSVKLAAEQINAEGGLLGRSIEVIGEDDDGGLDPVVKSTALNRLISYHEVDFIIGAADSTTQEIIAEHKKIFIAVSGSAEVLEQNVLDDYNKYKYYFTANWNSSCAFLGMTNSLLALRQNTGFNKIGMIGEDLAWVHNSMDGVNAFLEENGFEVVYKGVFPLDTMDFSSYFAAAEAAGVEGMLTLIAVNDGIAFVKEYHDRQSPVFIFGGLLGSIANLEAWEWTDGKCEDVCVAAVPVAAGYPFTTKTVPTREDYFLRYGEYPVTAIGFDILRFILADAIERASTIETDAVIEALEETSVETSNARNFVFSPSHGVMMGKNPNDPTANYQIILGFQWQNGQLLPVDPIKIMEEAGTSYTFPDWPGPWDDLD